MGEDPVCGKFVDELTAPLNSEHLGKKYYFCKELCKVRFDTNPEAYTRRRVQPIRRGGCCGGSPGMI
ncbi:MAG: YHS domain-containing protein [Candidatus Thorarchaeota archaeon]